MNRFRVLICGGGVAALEGLMHLRRLADDGVHVTLVAPNEEFAYRAFAVNEPFGYRSAQHYPMADIARETRAQWVRDVVTSVDCEERVAQTEGGEALAFDALLLAPGGTLSPAFDHVTTFNDAEADELFNGIVQDVELGYLDSICFLAPNSPEWPLPLYELALMTAERAYSMGIDKLDLTLVTPESAPLAVFGREASAAVSGLLDDAHIRVHPHASPKVPGPRQVLVRPGGDELRPTRIVALPRISGPSIAGIPTRTGGFIPIDKYCLVPDTDGRIFAAGDAVAYRIKHGGISAQQADIAAEGIARLVGVKVEARTFQPHIQGQLFTGRNSALYLSAKGLMSGEGFESQVSDKPLWEPAEKVEARELAPYLAGHPAGA